MGKDLTTRCQSGQDRHPGRKVYLPPTAEIIGNVTTTVLGGSPGAGDSSGTRTQNPPLPGDGGRPLPPPTR